MGRRGLGHFVVFVLVVALVLLGREELGEGVADLGDRNVGEQVVGQGEDQVQG